jgi:hypothetical protein
MKEHYQEIIQLIAGLEPGKLLFSTIIWALIFGLGALIVLLIFRKKVTQTRKYPILKYLAIAYFFIVPIGLAMFGAKLGVVRALHSTTISKLMEQKQTISTATNSLGMQFLVGNPNFQGNEFTNMSIEEMVAKASVLATDMQQQSIGQYASSGDGFTNKLAAVVNKITAGKFFGKLMTKVIADVLNEKLLLPKDATKDVMHAQFQDLVKNGLIFEIFLAQINKIFASLQKGSIIPIIILILIPLVEILIANYWNKKKVIVAA